MPLTKIFKFILNNFKLKKGVWFTFIKDLLLKGLVLYGLYRLLIDFSSLLSVSEELPPLEKIKSDISFTMEGNQSDDQLLSNQSDDQLLSNQSDDDDIPPPSPPSASVEGVQGFSLPRPWFKKFRAVNVSQGCTAFSEADMKSKKSYKAQAEAFSKAKAWASYKTKVQIKAFKEAEADLKKAEAAYRAEAKAFEAAQANLIAAKKAADKALARAKAKEAAAKEAETFAWAAEETARVQQQNAEEAEKLAWAASAVAKSCFAAAAKKLAEAEEAKALAAEDHQAAQVLFKQLNLYVKIAKEKEKVAKEKVAKEKVDKE